MEISVEDSMQFQPYTLNFVHTFPRSLILIIPVYGQNISPKVSEGHAREIYHRVYSTIHGRDRDNETRNHGTLINRLARPEI